MDNNMATNAIQTCKEVIDALMQSGGKFICDYKQEKCTLDRPIGPKLTCKIDYLNGTAVDIDNLLFSIAPWNDKYVSYLPLDKSFRQFKLHQYQDFTTGGFKIELNKNEKNGPIG